MTKKDYELIAGQIRRLVDSNSKSYRISVIEHLANLLEQDNPKFNRDKFLQACGIETRAVALKKWHKDFNI